MNVGRQWVRRLALLLAAGVVVVQVPALVGIGLSGASAAHPGPTPTPKHTRATATPTNRAVRTCAAAGEKDSRTVGMDNLSWPYRWRWRRRPTRTG